MKHSKRFLSILLSLALILCLLPGMSLTAYADTEADGGTTTITSDRTDDYIYIYDGTLIINQGVTFTCNNAYFKIKGNGSKVELHGTLTGNVSFSNWASGVINVYLSDGAKYTVTGQNPPNESDLRYYGYDAATDGNGTVSVKNGTTDVTSESMGYKTTAYTYTATPASGYKFKNWTKGADGEVLGTDASIDVTCEQNGQYQVYANFEENNHTHSFTYNANGDTITAECTADDCDLPEVDGKHIATLTISAPTTGNDATITVSPEGTLTGYTVKYQSKSGGTWGTETQTAPSAAGIHRAIVTLGGVDASVTYGNNCITYATGLANGSISGDAGATCGATITPTITPDEGYELDALTVTPEEGSGVTSVEMTADGTGFVMPEANVTVSATFKKINRAITVTQPTTGGTITAKKNNADVTSADYGDTITLGNTPAEGYNFTSYTVTKTDDSSTTVTVTDGAFTMPGYPVTVTGAFTPIDYTVTVSGTTNGTVQASKTSNAHVGDEITLTVNPDVDYTIDTLTVTKAGGGTVAVADNKFTMPADNVTVSATFKAITYTVMVNGNVATVQDNLATPNEYTATLSVEGKTYDGTPVAAATVTTSAGFPTDKVAVGEVSYTDANNNAVASPVNVGSYTASAAVGDKTISQSFEIAGRTPITYYTEDGTITTGQYLPIENNPNGIVFMRDGMVYVVKGDVTIGALVYTGNVTLVLCENTTLRIRAGIYHIGSRLNIYTENGSDNAAIVVNGESLALSGLGGYSELTGAVSEEGASISGNVNMYDGSLTVNKGSNTKLAGDDISLTLGKNVSVSGLTGGTTNADGSVTYGKAAFANLTSLAVKPVAVVTTAPEAKTLTYTGSAQELVTAGTAKGGTMQYALGTATEATEPYTTSIPAATNAGTYYVWYQVGGDFNHNNSEAACVTVTVNPKAATVTADAKTKTYDNDPSTDPALTATVSGVVEGDTLNYTLSRTAGQNVDEYDITVTLGDNPNYTVSTVGAKFTITKAEPTYTAPEAKQIGYTGEPEELVVPGATEGGTMLYSLDGESFSEAIPTATELGTYTVWYMVQGDANHLDSEPASLEVTIRLTICGSNDSSLALAFVENGERLYRYDVMIKNIPENFNAVGMQVFLNYDNALLTLRRVENGAVEWTHYEKNNTLLFAWAGDTPVALENDEVLFSLVFAASDDAAGAETALPFTANAHGAVSAVSAAEDGKVVEYTAATVDGMIRFATPVWGDANDDGIITAADAAMILRAIVGLSELNLQGAFNADVDGDLEVTAQDAVLILRYLIGMIEQFPVTALD